MGLENFIRWNLPEDIAHGDAGPTSSWAVGAYTGYKIHKQGTHTPLQTLNAALSWRIWSGVLIWWLGVWAVGTTIFMWGGIAWGYLPVAIPIVAINTVVVYLAMGLSFVRLCVLSQFRIRGPLKPCWHLALLIPNVNCAWLYVIPFLPLLWGLTLVEVMSAMNKVYVDGKVHVRMTQCRTCIFRPGNLMHLEEGRKEQMERDAVANESVIPCHTHLHEGAPIEPVCRGYWDAHWRDVAPLRLAEALGITKYVNPDSA